jgi:hypothetical protein
MSSTKWTVYCHTHIESGRRYIGLTKKTMMFRWNQHLSNAMHKHGKGCAHFWNAIRKYGKEAFAHEILETCTSLKDANTAEQKWIDFHDTRNPEKGFNLARGGEHVPHPFNNPWNRPEYRAKQAARIIKVDQLHTPEVRAATKATLNTLESKMKRSAIMKTSHARPEVIAKISATSKDRGPEFCAKISKIRKGKHHSLETRAKISGISKRSMTSGFKKYLARKSRDKWQDPEYRKKVISSNKSHLSEVRQKISAALSRRSPI